MDRPEGSGSLVVAMMQTTEPWRRDNFATRCRTFCWLPTCGSLFVQAEVRSILMIVANVVIHKPLEMALVDHDDMIEQISAAVPDEALGHAVLPGTSNRGADWPYAKTLYGFQNLTMKSVLPIEDEVHWRGIVRERFTELLSNPRGRRVARDAAMKNTPPIMGNHEEAIEHAEGQRGHSEEVHRGNRFAMVAQKRCPTLGWLGISGSFAHPTKHGPFRNIEAQHSEFAMDPRRTPGAILGYHTEDQLTQFRARRLSSNYGMFAREPFPIHLEAGTMPTHDSVWLDQDQNLSPSRPQPAQYNPKESVGSGKSWLRMAPRHDRELLPEGKILQK